MGIETGLTIGGISILTIIVSKLKCFAKKNGHCNYGCGFLDMPLIEDDDTEIKTVELGDVHILYVRKRHRRDQETETESETETDE